MKRSHVRLAEVSLKETEKVKFSYTHVLNLFYGVLGTQKVCWFNLYRRLLHRADCGGEPSERVELE